MKTPEEFVSFGQANVEAFVKSGQIFATGMQDLSKQIATSAQASLDEAMNTFRAMTSVKSIKEAVELQTTLARSAVEKAMTQTSQMADASMKLAEQAIAPIAGRMTVAAETFGKAA